MTKEEKKKYDAMETALKIIHTWASYHWENYEKIFMSTHAKNLKDIADKCLEALGKKR